MATSFASIMAENQEDIVVKDLKRSDIELRSSAKVPYDVMRLLIKSVGLMYEFQGQVLLTNTEQFAEDIFKEVQAVVHGVLRTL